MLAARASCDLTAYDGDLPGSTVPVLAAEPGSAQPQREVSPTQIQTWANCPHAYFMRYLLGVKPVEEPGSQISINPLDRGSVQHDALDAFHRDVIEGRLPQPGETGWTDTHLDALLAHFDTATANAERQGRTGRPATWAGERARMRSDLADWLQHDNDIVRVGKVTVLASEHRFPAPSTELFPVDVPDPVSLRLLALFFLPAVAYRIVVEERMLFQIEGYPEFAAKRWRLIP